MEEDTEEALQKFLKEMRLVMQDTVNFKKSLIRRKSALSSLLEPENQPPESSAEKINFRSEKENLEFQICELMIGQEESETLFQDMLKDFHLYFLRAKGPQGDRRKLSLMQNNLKKEQLDNLILKE